MLKLNSGSSGGCRGTEQRPGSSIEPTTSSPWLSAGGRRSWGNGSAHWRRLPIRRHRAGSHFHAGTSFGFPHGGCPGPHARCPRTIERRNLRFFRAALVGTHRGDGRGPQPSRCRPESVGLTPLSVRRSWAESRGSRGRLLSPSRSTGFARTNAVLIRRRFGNGFASRRRGRATPTSRLNVNSATLVGQVLATDTDI